jgi:hypothetical protein
VAYPPTFLCPRAHPPPARPRGGGGGGVNNSGRNSYIIWPRDATPTFLYREVGGGGVNNSGHNSYIFLTAGRNSYIFLTAARNSYVPLLGGWRGGWLTTREATSTFFWPQDATRTFLYRELGGWGTTREATSIFFWPRDATRTSPFCSSVSHPLLLSSILSYVLHLDSSLTHLTFFWWWLYWILSSAMWYIVATLVDTKVSEENIASIFRIYHSSSPIIIKDPGWHTYGHKLQSSFPESSFLGS